MNISVIDSNGLDVVIIASIVVFHCLTKPEVTFSSWKVNGFENNKIKED